MVLTLFATEKAVQWVPRKGDSIHCKNVAIDFQGKVFEWVPLSFI